LQQAPRIAIGRADLASCAGHGIGVARSGCIIPAGARSRPGDNVTTGLEEFGAAAYLMSNQERFAAAVSAHVTLSLAALLIGLAVCLPLGILAARSSRIAFWSINAVSVVRVIPSLGILVLVLAVLGFGFAPTLVALTVLACLPILINTCVACRDVSPAVREVAVGIGMTPRQIL